uniref:Uncharacterized protein n=1 Tax=Anopheles atroparvus TaxID=41427 RepID=A0AAG5CW70_ANOAO
MQFLRNSLSLSFISNPQNQAQPATNGTTENGGTSGVPRRGDDEGKHPSPSPSVSTVSERTKYATVRSKVPLDLGSPPSAYSTPFQSPIITSRTFPVLSDAARALNDNGSNDTSNDGTGERGQERPSKVYFIEQGQLQTSYELPERPGNRGTRAADSGFVNSAFTNDSGATMINMSSTQPSVIREQYWTWSCRCQREYTSREKVLLIVIFILVLIIGGLAAYLGIVVDSDDSITGGILTVNSLALSPAAQR